MECDVNAIGVSGIEDLFKEWRINRIKDVKIRFAVMGASGVGKSAFINAIRWIDDDDEDAAKTGTFETTTEPIPYIFPDNPNITLVDLPGFGTPCFPDLATYCDKIALGTYDIFLLFTTPKLKQSDLELAKIIKSMGKSFFLICTKIDLYVLVKKHRKEPDVEVMFKRIRAGCYKKVKEFEIREDEIFLISNYEKDKWDFSRLIQAILETLPRKKRHHQKEAPNLSLKSLSTDAVSRDTDVSKSVTEEYPVDAGAYNKKNVDHDIEKFLKKKLGGRKDVKIRFGVTGYIDTGKSAFINAIRGLNDDDDGAANVHITETTTKPTEYYHPENPTICFVDLPSIGTPDSPDLPTYCKKVGFESYDKYLVFSSSSSTIYDLELAKKVKSIKKSFFLIRAKIDNDCENEAKKKKFNEKELLEKIKKHCFENVKDYISSENEIFLISNYDREKWDFCRLVEAISDV